MDSVVSGFETPRHPVSIYLIFMAVVVCTYMCGCMYLLFHGLSVPFYLQQTTVFRDWEEGEGEGFSSLCTHVTYVRMYVHMYVTCVYVRMCCM